MPASGVIARIGEASHESDHLAVAGAQQELGRAAGRCTRRRRSSREARPACQRHSQLRRRNPDLKHTEIVGLVDHRGNTKGLHIEGNSDDWMTMMFGCALIDSTFGCTSLTGLGAAACRQTTRRRRTARQMPRKRGCCPARRRLWQWARRRMPRLRVVRAGRSASARLQLGAGSHTRCRGVAKTSCIRTRQRDYTL